jgi:pimeloyl-ACP methyl ester carboxylesterase
MVDGQRIGLLASSQGGYVIARALAQTNDVAFAICDSCAGMPGNDQMAYQIALWALCGDASTHATDEVAPMLAELRVAAEYDTYEEYLRYREVLAGIAELAGAELRGRSPESKDTWETNPLDPETYWNPIQALEGTKVPILAIFGDHDRNVDPFQGAYAWRQALAESGHPYSRIVVFAGVGHALLPVETGCPEEYERTINRYLRSKGFDPADPSPPAQNEEPYQPGYLSDYPWVPGALDQIHEWLRGLQ